MSVKITIPNTSSDYLTFGSANTPDAAKIGGYEDSTGNGHLELYTTASGTSTERMRIDASGNVGIGTSSPVSYSGYTTLAINNGTNGGLIDLMSNGTTQGQVFASATEMRFSKIGANYQTFWTNGSERMRIDSNGNVLVGTTSSLSGNRANIVAGDYPLILRATNATAGKYWFTGPNSSNNYAVFNQGTTGVYISDGATSWTASSDERIKDIIEPIENAAEKVSSLRAVIGKYKTDEEGTRRAFLIAQDIQAVLPEAVEASNPDNLGVQYTDVIPLLVAAIKEQQELIKQLQADVAALKGTV